MNKKYLPIISSVLFFTSGILIQSCKPGPDSLFDFPDYAQPERIGRLVSENLLSREYMIRASGIGLHYAETATADGAIRFANLTEDEDLMARLYERYSCFIDSSECNHLSIRHIRNNIAILMISFYDHYKEQEYLDRALELLQVRFDRWADADSVTGLPDSPRYWSDDMYFGTTMDSRLYILTGDTNCTHRVTNWLRAYIDTLQLPNGLIKHTWQVDCLWGRGVGWPAAGLTEALLALPEDHPDYPYIMDSYLALMSGLLPYQSENGLWRQLIDVPEAWEETSGTGMIAFALITGIKQGWLDEATYGQAARDAWLGLVAEVNEDGSLEKVCIGTNEKTSIQGYLDRPARAGDFHGQAALLWATNALLADPGRE